LDYEKKIQPNFLNLYIYKSKTGWLGVFVCVLLGDGGLLLCSGAIFFLVSSRYFLWGLFRGGIFFGVRSKGIFLCLLLGLLLEEGEVCCYELSEIPLEHGNIFGKSTIIAKR
jgi:hypothetical protein